MRVDELTGANSVDHCLPKSSKIELAYEWSNYRFACARMNSRKGIVEHVLDPFEIDDDWFQLEIHGFQVRPNPKLPAATRAQVQATISQLGLNDSLCRARRERDTKNFLDELVSFELLERESPFVARELLRLGLATRTRGRPKRR
ncbi:hypothetical protein ACNOYE_01450 [Nannocystaceae bacterium ST9]